MGLWFKANIGTGYQFYKRLLLYSVSWNINILSLFKMFYRRFQNGRLFRLLAKVRTINERGGVGFDVPS